MIIDVSKEARDNLSAIAFYTFLNFGERQMYIYNEQFEFDFKRIARNPNVGKKRPEIGGEIFSIVSGSHVIFYKVKINVLYIIKVVHGSRDIPKEFRLDDEN